MTNNAPFPCLRWAYMRAVADKWQETQTWSNLISPHVISYETLIGMGASERNKHDFLSNGVFAKLVEDPHCKDATVFQWKLRFFICNNESPQWSPNVSGGWMGGNDILKIYIPQSNVLSSLYGPLLLASYGYWWPTFLGWSVRPDVSVEVPPNEFTNFSTEMLRLIAACWADAKILEEILEATPAETVRRFEVITGGRFPWSFGLKFEPWCPRGEKWAEFILEVLKCMFGKHGKQLDQPPCLSLPVLEMIVERLLKEMAKEGFWGGQGGEAFKGVSDILSAAFEDVLHEQVPSEGSSSSPKELNKMVSDLHRASVGGGESAWKRLLELLRWFERQLRKLLDYLWRMFQKLSSECKEFLEFWTPKFWMQLPIPEVYVQIPEPPKDVPCKESCKVQSVALAAYNGTGAQYPFSCV